MAAAGKARMILRGLAAQHLQGWLPGNDHQAAISAVVAGAGGWSEDAGWGQVVPTGVGIWPDHGTHERCDALTFVTWAQVLAVVARGCGDGRREAYEAAYTTFGRWVHRDRWMPGEDHATKAERYAAESGPSYTEAHRGIRATTAAIIEHGCQTEAVQEALFDIGPGKG